VNALQKMLGQHSDLLMVALVIGVLGVLFIPIPSGLLDFLILANFSGVIYLSLATADCHLVSAFAQCGGDPFNFGQW
jgi:flagellar biosynthesis protein FlhA